MATGLPRSFSLTREASVAPHATFSQYFGRIPGELNIMRLGSLQTVPIIPLKHPFSNYLNTVHCDGKCFFLPLSFLALTVASSSDRQAKHKIKHCLTNQVDVKKLR